MDKIYARTHTNMIIMDETMTMKHEAIVNVSKTNQEPLWNFKECGKRDTDPIGELFSNLWLVIWVVA